MREGARSVRIQAPPLLALAFILAATAISSCADRRDHDAKATETAKVRFKELSEERRWKCFEWGSIVGPPLEGHDARWVFVVRGIRSAESEASLDLYELVVTRDCDGAATCTQDEKLTKVEPPDKRFDKATPKC
jgi:hypothetical protein